MLCIKITSNLWLRYRPPSLELHRAGPTMRGFTNTSKLRLKSRRKYAGGNVCLWYGQAWHLTYLGRKAEVNMWVAVDGCGMGRYGLSHAEGNMHVAMYVCGMGRHGISHI